MTTYISALPAYGRDYKSQKAVKEDWIAGRDFQDARTGSYLSIRDFANEPDDVHVSVRYANHTKVVNVR